MQQGDGPERHNAVMAPVPRSDFSALPSNISETAVRTSPFGVRAQCAMLMLMIAREMVRGQIHHDLRTARLRDGHRLIEQQHRCKDREETN